MAEEKKEGKSFSENLLSETQRKDYRFVKSRIGELQEFRKNHYGVNLDKLWSEADHAYIPHRLGTTTNKRVVVSDDEKGWRGTLVRVGDANWQSDIASTNPFIKIQTALSILVDQNPSAVLTATSKQYQATTELIRQLFQRSWEYAKSKQQLKLFVFNLAKYGWACARTYPLHMKRKVKVLVEFNPEDPDSSVYEEREVTEYNDIFRENLDPRNCWIDDMARPSNSMSVRDWAWRKVYSLEQAELEFGNYKFWNYVKPGGITTETIDGSQKVQENEKKETDLVEIYFYENRMKDLFMVLINDVPVVIAPLPVSDAKGNKKLSCWQTFWTLRHGESPYGIGIYEVIRYDNAMLDRLNNMTMDQVTLSIYKMFFYTGTQNLTDTGTFNITPGVGKQVLNPKDINWLEVPGPGKDAYLGIEMQQKRVDESSGITEPLIGEVTGKTAFELAQAKESALKRLKTPLDNILDALNEEGYLTISLIQLLYSTPETYQIVNEELIEAYLQEIGGDTELFERTIPDPEDLDETGLPRSVFSAKVYREFPLNLDKDEEGNLYETNDTRFFRVKPSGLKWEGVINVKAQSILTPSKQVDRVLELEMHNILIPLLRQPPEIYSKIAKNIVKLYDKDPREVLPEMWLQDQMMMPVNNQDVIIPAEQAMSSGTIPGMGQQPPQAERLVSRVEAPQQSQGIIGRIASKITQPFR